jgi:hypothetical protein
MTVEDDNRQFSMSKGARRVIIDRSLRVSRRPPPIVV